MARKLFSDIFQEFATATDDDERIALLQINQSEVLRSLLNYAYNPVIKFDTAIPVYKENTETDGYSANSLYAEHKRLYIFTDGFTKVTPERKTEILDQILSSIDKSDAILVTKIVSRQLDEFGLNKDLINKAFPGLIR